MGAIGWIGVSLFVMGVIALIKIVASFRPSPMTRRQAHAINDLIGTLRIPIQEAIERDLGAERSSALRHGDWITGEEASKVIDWLLGQEHKDTSDNIGCLP